MTPEQAIAEAAAGELRPVYLVLGEERHLVSKVVAALQTAALTGDVTGLNEDHLTAGEVDVDRILSAARTLPMMARRRFVLVRDLERWEPRSGKAGRDGPPGGKGRGGEVAPLDRLAEHAAAPAESTTLVLVASKLDGRRRLVTTAKKAGWLVSCEPPARNALPRWVEAAARERGKAFAPGAAELLADVAGPELALLEDAVERLSLYVGEEREIGEDAVAECVGLAKPATVWQLVDAIGQRNPGAALAVLARVYDPQDRGLRLVGVLAWSTRQMIRFTAATQEGASPQEAAARAGAPPFKAQKLASQASRIPTQELGTWLETLQAVDSDLKGGSRRSPRAVLEAAVLDMCGRLPARAAPGATASPAAPPQIDRR